MDYIFSSKAPESHGKDIFNIVLGTIIIIATVVCYFFQIYNLIKNKTAKGISFASFIMTNLTSYMNFMSSVVLNYDKIVSYHIAGIHLFIQSWQTIILLGVLYLCYFVIINLYLIYFLRENDPKFILKHNLAINEKRKEKLYRKSIHEETEDENVDEKKTLLNHTSPTNVESCSVNEDDGFEGDDEDEEEPDEDNELIKPVGVFQIFITIIGYFGYIYFVIGMSTIAILGFPFFGIDFGRFSIVRYAETVAVISSVIVWMQWVPQIIITIKNKGAGNFSVTMLVIMLIGAVANIVYLVFAKQSWVNWLPYVVTMVQQIILMSLIIFFAIYKVVKKKVEKEQ